MVLIHKSASWPTLPPPPTIPSTANPPPPTASQAGSPSLLPPPAMTFAIGHYGMPMAKQRQHHRQPPMPVTTSITRQPTRPIRIKPP